MTLQQDIAEITYNSFNITRGAGGTMCPKPWNDLPKKDKKRWLRIAQAIENHLKEHTNEYFGVDEEKIHNMDIPLSKSRTHCVEINEFTANFLSQSPIVKMKEDK